MKKEVILGLGSNLGDRQFYISKACEMISELDCTVVKRSSFYNTPPWGFESENEFCNIVIKILTKASPVELLKQIKEIERDIGRTQKRSDTYTSRKIDIDILDYNGEVIECKGLSIPHVHMVDRNFVMVPLEEIEPSWIHPVSRKSITFLLSQLNLNDIYRS